MDQLFQAPDGRQDKWTVITTNRSLEDLATIDARIQDRLLRRKSRVVTCETISYSMRASNIGDGFFRRLTRLMREVIEKTRPEQPPGIQGVFRRERYGSWRRSEVIPIEAERSVPDPVEPIASLPIQVGDGDAGFGSRHVYPEAPWSIRSVGDLNGLH